MYLVDAGYADGICTHQKFCSSGRNETISGRNLTAYIALPFCHRDAVGQHKCNTGRNWILTVFSIFPASTNRVQFIGAPQSGR